MTEAFSAVECNACFVEGFKVFLEKIKGEFFRRECNLKAVLAYRNFL